MNDGVQTRVQSFNYDKVNRLSVASEDALWTQNYLYDAYGNRAVNSVYVPYPVVTPQASDAAGTAIFLASAASAYITGAVIPLDGGFSTTR